ncbi:mannose-6-phosphate isomerase, class I [Corynebacterium sp. sy039]|uniref:mannose-6-phosphate isomerase, class I n=1 Tax=Corynebacterium sp. sy039 TaxID=2599641 RepID=UPI0011B62772|nr:mannose-6-phosphate isomerase, class I [Corynebacterium sp. sy039]QDZ43484.1 mannose-6-phosphate isomerase, class I [Corynebacterium sp. sy039]
MQLLSPSVQHYSWGSRTLIAQLKGEEASARPEAELWFGAHPGAPSLVENGDTLLHYIEQDPTVLGERVCAKYRNTLPFLLKILAADAPLSLQAHPSKQQAEEGFAKENEQDIALSAHNRNYKDDNHKPELIVALTQFHAMAGFRPLARTLELFNTLGCDQLARYCSVLDDSGSDESNLRALFTTWITIPIKARHELIDAVILAAKKALDMPAPVWIKDCLTNVINLNERYPGDIGVLSALLLNYIVLEPGEALYLDAGNLHAYVSGLGVEIMANSDNVLRGGLTPKHIDIAELIKVLRFDSLDDPRVPCEHGHYRVPIDEFALRCLVLDSQQSSEDIVYDSACIALCTRGEVTVRNAQETKTLSAAGAVWIDAHEEVHISGKGHVYLATVKVT